METLGKYVGGLFIALLDWAARAGDWTSEYTFRYRLKLAEALMRLAMWAGPSQLRSGWTGSESEVRPEERD